MTDRPLKTRHDGDCEIFASFVRICTCGFQHEQLPITEGKVYPESDLATEAESRRVLSLYYEEKERIADPLGLSPTIVQRSREQHAAGDTVSLQDFLASLASEEVVRAAEGQVVLLALQERKTYIDRFLAISRVEKEQAAQAHFEAQVVMREAVEKLSNILAGPRGPSALDASCPTEPTP